MMDELGCWLDVEGVVNEKFLLVSFLITISMDNTVYVIRELLVDYHTF